MTNLGSSPLPNQSQISKLASVPTEQQNAIRTSSLDQKKETPQIRDSQNIYQKMLTQLTTVKEKPFPGAKEQIEMEIYKGNRIIVSRDVNLSVLKSRESEQDNPSSLKRNAPNMMDTIKASDQNSIGENESQMSELQKSQNLLIQILQNQMKQEIQSKVDTNNLQHQILKSAHEVYAEETYDHKHQVKVQPNTKSNDSVEDDGYTDNHPSDEQGLSKSSSKQTVAINQQETSGQNFANKLLRDSIRLGSSITQNEGNVAQQEIVPVNIFDSQGWEQDSYLNETDTKIVSLLQSIHYRSPADLKILGDYLNQFDFMKKSKQQKDKENTDKKQRPRSEHKSLTIDQVQNKVKNSESETMDLAKDTKTFTQMLRVMKHLIVPKHQMVFDYMSQGDLFYMVVKGKVLCKVPIENQYIYLSDNELQMFKQEHSADLQNIYRAKIMAKKLEDIPEKELLAAYKQLGITFCKNPYDVKDREELIAHLDKVIDKEKYKVLRSLRSEKSRVGTTSHRSLNERKDDSTSSHHALTEDEDAIEGEKEVRPLFRGQPISPIEEKQLKHNVGLINLLKAADKIIKNFGRQENENRQLYCLTLLTVVKVYQPLESFGELALINNRRRKAKLEVTGDCDAHFALLSKKDYRQAIYKVQNQILEEKMNFLRQYELFQNLSNAQLNSLSYGMVDTVYNNRQVVYNEGLDPAENIYLVKRGEFQCIKTIMKDLKIPNENSKMRYSFDMNDPEDRERAQDISKMRTTLKMKIYNTGYQKQTTEAVEICIHGKHDIFGYQELMDGEKDITRRYTVTCKSAEGILVIIHKSHIEPFLRRNTEILIQMIKKFSSLVDSRIKNQHAVKQERKPTNTGKPLTKESLGQQVKEAAEEEEEAEKEKEIKIKTPQIELENIHYPVVREHSPIIDQKIAKKWQTLERSTIQASKQLSPTCKLDQAVKDIPQQYQTFVDKNYGQIQKSMVSSLTKNDLESMRSIDYFLNNRIQEQKFRPDSINHSQDMLKLILMDRRLRVKQTLYNPESALAKEKDQNLLSIQLQSINARPESQMLPQINRPSTEVNESQNQLKVKKQIDQIVQDCDILTKAGNDFSSAANKAFKFDKSTNDDWSKESAIVASQCFKFMGSAQSEQHFRTVDSQLLMNESQQTIHTLQLDETQALQLEKHLKTQTELKKYSDDYRKMQNRIQKQINNRKELDFEKDIEQLIQIKQQSSISNKARQFFSVQTTLSANAQNKSLNSIRNHNQQKTNMLKSNLLENPLINLEIAKRNKIPVTTQMMMEKPYDRDQEQNRHKKKYVFFDKTKKPKLRVYRSSKDFGDSIMAPFGSKDASYIGKSIDQEEGMSIINKLAVNSVDQRDFQNQNDQIPTPKTPQKDKETLFKSVFEKPTIESTLLYHNNLTFQSITGLSYNHQLQGPNSQIDTVKHFQQNSKLLVPKPKVIMRQLVFDSDSFNTKVIQDQDYLRTSMQSKLNWPSSIKQGTVLNKLDFNNLNPIEPYSSIEIKIGGEEYINHMVTPKETPNNKTHSSIRPMFSNVNIDSQKRSKVQSRPMTLDNQSVNEDSGDGPTPIKRNISSRDEISGGNNARYTIVQPIDSKRQSVNNSKIGSSRQSGNKSKLVQQRKNSQSAAGNIRSKTSSKINLVNVSSTKSKHDLSQHDKRELIPEISNPYGITSYLQRADAASGGGLSKVGLKNKQILINDKKDHKEMSKTSYGQKNHHTGEHSFSVEVSDLKNKKIILPENDNLSDNKSIQSAIRTEHNPAGSHRLVDVKSDGTDRKVPFISNKPKSKNAISEAKSIGETAKITTVIPQAQNLDYQFDLNNNESLAEQVKINQIINKSIIKKSRLEGQQMGATDTMFYKKD